VAAAGAARALGARGRAGRPPAGLAATAVTQPRDLGSCMLAKAVMPGGNRASRAEDPAAAPP
jgi:hypothetical protein